MALKNQFVMKRMDIRFPMGNEKFSLNFYFSG